jgi:hypothetical protein
MAFVSVHSWPDAVLDFAAKAMVMPPSALLPLTDKGLAPVASPLGSIVQGFTRLTRRTPLRSRPMRLKSRLGAVT